ncbi:alpha-1,4-glucan--maltose-1-phosphate maltosyltransferase [Phyllobacterium endophyticum]|uniref:alpha-1,4-glucan--maltose-1-phosphate maltosyltransferase n=1 Tax=Phyllobacterium endophyticum TaxID=1149773 RepID=UPI001FEED842|nr:alpha-1,4-glucan--maltose-1-phosphate maltosyltransferase [Phyllobacterium endophyticum]
MKFQKSNELYPSSSVTRGRAFRLPDMSAARIAIENVTPEINAGRFPAKAIQTEDFVVEADIFSDGHDVLQAALVLDRGGKSVEYPMRLVDNDRWETRVQLADLGLYKYTIVAWRDLFASWSREIRKKIEAAQDVTVEIVEGHNLVQSALAALKRGTRSKLDEYSKRLAAASNDEEKLAILLSGQLLDEMARTGIKSNLSRYDRELEVVVDRSLAGFGAWYELFPRSQSTTPGRHGTFEDVIQRLPYVKQLGFDVLYFPPIHPIGATNRKGPNNSLIASPGDPGSPYAIGAEAGGHDAIHPELGTIEDFERLVRAAYDEGLEIALDFAIQCSPDHPWVKDHPEWFNRRPDGSIKFAENPPKKYEDIVNVELYGSGKEEVWAALLDVVLFWIARGVKIFRVDNPHTKPFPFWEWLIAEARRADPAVIFLAEAFTRPKIMARLAKLGFTQSYSYFTWRNEKHELQEYLTQLTQGEAKHFMRPNFFANTPDINPFYLQASGRPGFQVRLILAATLAGSYGIYNGFEICEAAAVPGKEEYLNSEKYQLREWKLDGPGNISEDISRINRLRREHPALRAYTSLKFYNAWNDNILYYGKIDGARDSFILLHVNLDPHNAQEFQFEVPLWEFDLPDDASVEVEDLVHGNRFTWHGKVHTLRLDPNVLPYAIWRLFPPGSGR